MKARTVKAGTENELRELRRRVRQYERLLVRWRRAYGKAHWKEGETVTEVEEDLMHAAGTVILERQLARRKRR